MLIGTKFLCGVQFKASACNAGDPGSIPGLGRSPGEGNGKLLQYSCMENPMDRRAWQDTVHRVARVSQPPSKSKKKKSPKMCFQKPKQLGAGINQEFGINIYTLLCIKQVTNKDLLYSAGNSTQYSVITYVGKMTEKEWIYIYV